MSRSYGSVLPTSLTHIVLSARGFSPRRPAAVVGTTDGTSQFCLWPTDFQGSSRAHRTPHQWRRSAGPSGLSPVRPLPGPSRDPRQQETTTLAGALADVSVVLSVVADSYDGSMMSVREYRPDSLSRTPLFQTRACSVQDRLTRVRLPLTRNPRPRRPSKVSFE